MATAIHSLDSHEATRPPADDLEVSIAGCEIPAPDRPHICFSLPFAEEVRRALICNRVDTSHFEAITGKRKDGTPLDGHLHAHYLPTDEDRDGRIDHITTYAPRGFDQANLEALGRLRDIFRSVNRPEVELVLTGLGGQELFSRDAGKDACAPTPTFAEAQRWRSVTPVSLPRFPSREVTCLVVPADEGVRRRTLSFKLEITDCDFQPTPQ
jgi:hypothetical protein